MKGEEEEVEGEEENSRKCKECLILLEKGEPFCF